MMLLTSKKCWIPLAIFLLVPILTYAQDLHYTQFYNAPHTYNPAHVGVYSGDQRMQGSLRDQWFSLDDLTWDRQWDGETFNAGAGTGENFDAQRVNFMETGLGLNYRYQRSARTKVDVGVGALHLIEPNAGFYNNADQKLPMHLNFSMIGSIYLLPRLDLQLHGLHQMQGEYRETIIGGLGKIYVNNDRGNETELHVGLGYRLTGSLAPTLAIQYRQIYVGASYDTDRTDFNTILEDNKGGPEFHVRYTITHVKPLKEFKVCPIY